jgi:hypothetical protein
MPTYPIDLGRKSGLAPAEPFKPSEKHYPTIYLDDVAGEIDLPDDGVMTVRFHKTSETTTDREGVKTQCACLEIREIVKVKGEAPKEDDKSPGEVLDDLLAEKQKESEDY